MPWLCSVAVTSQAPSPLQTHGDEREDGRHEEGVVAVEEEATHIIRKLPIIRVRALVQLNQTQ